MHGEGGLRCEAGHARRLPQQVCRADHRTSREREGLGGDLEVLAVPAQTLLDPRALFDQVIPVVREKPQVVLGTGKTRDRKTGLAQRGPDDTRRVDGTRLAVGLGARACAGHQLGWHADHALAGGKG